MRKTWDWDEEAALVKEIPIAAGQELEKFCIPSVVTCVHRAGEVFWYIGDQAAELTPAEGNGKVYRDLKEQLFSQEYGRPERNEEYREVGKVFFRELKKTLMEMNLTWDVGSCPVRVCIPRLREDDSAQELMAGILNDAGWRPAENRGTVYEPESNVCGVLTRGRNKTWYPKTWEPRCPTYLYMYGRDGVIEEFRRAWKTKRKGNYRVLVIDVGAFTTDFGYVKFDDSFWDNDIRHPDVIQISREIGVRKLDQAIIEQMNPEVQRAIQQTSASGREDFNRLLYKGDSAAIRIPAGGMLIIEKGGAEAQRIDAAIASFAGRIVDAKDDFRTNHVKGKIDAQVLTGGGSMIPKVRSILVESMKQDGASSVYDLLDENEPRKVQEKGLWPIGLPFNLEQIEQRNRRSRELVRGGSAIGGCSVSFE